MPTRDGILDYIDTAYGNAHDYYHFAKTELFWAKQNFGIASDHDVLEAICDGCYYLYISVGQLNTFSDPIAGKGQLPYFLRYFTIDEAPEPEEYELTWRKICEALVADDFESRYWFISIIDHLRTLIWDKPYNIMWAIKPDKE